jgi:hypothetical protein
VTRRERVEITLFITVLVGVTVGQVASCIHLITAYAWANSPAMSIVMASVAVTGSGVLIALIVLTPSGRGRVALQLGLGLLMFTELLGNFAAGGLLAQHSMPAQVASLFGLSQGTAMRLVAVFFAAAIPVLVWLELYATTVVADRLLKDPVPNPLALKVLQREADVAAEQRA